MANDNKGNANGRSIQQDFSKKTYASFEEFYVDYMSFHTVPLSNLFHFIGITAFLASIIVVEIYAITHGWRFTLPIAAGAYLLAWVGHFAIEKNRPASFNNPLWSIRAGARMYREMLSGKVRIW